MEHRINKIYERAFRVIYRSDSKLTFKELLDENKTVSIQPKNLASTSHSNIQSKANPAGTRRCNKVRFWLHFGRVASTLCFRRRY